MLSQIARSVLTSNVNALKRTSQGLAGTLTLVQAVNAIHTTEYRRDDNKNKKRTPRSTALILHSFGSTEHKEKDAYLDILRQYKKDNILKRGHVEFIQVALKYMDEFGVNRDLSVYKDLLDVLPKGKFIPTSYAQTIFMHYPKQQYVAVELLSKMEHNCVIPDVEMQEMLLNIFGVQGEPLKKFWRMLYWMPKFANLHPWPCPKPVPKDPQVLAKLAVSKVSSVDVSTIVTEFQTKDFEDSTENTWIVSSMSNEQQELLQKQPTNNPIYVEGPHSVWVANYCIDYFVLRGDARKRKEEVYKDPDGK